VSANADHEVAVLRKRVADLTAELSVEKEARVKAEKRVIAYEVKESNVGILPFNVERLDVVARGGPNDLGHVRVGPKEAQWILKELRLRENRGYRNGRESVMRSKKVKKKWRTR
jgi:hypothetical protein